MIAIQKIDHVGIRIREKARSIAFYEGLGFALIVDTGFGIPAENLLRITEPLFSTKARGIGLGLALTQAILGKHNSRLNAESEAGQGTTIVISVPKAPA